MHKGKERVLEVCEEETLSDILENKYSQINAHCDSYTWKFQGRTLDMSKTLEQNDVPDESDLFDELDMNHGSNVYVPSLFLYFNDDHTTA